MTREDHASIILVSALMLVLLVGCAAPPAKSEAPVTSEPAATAPAETPVEEAAPAAPSDISGMRGWFEAAYPGAPWLARITDIEYVKGEVPDSGGFADAIVVTTDLDFETEQAIGQEITAALGEAHPEWAKQYVVWFADGNNLQAGDIFDPTP